MEIFQTPSFKKGSNLIKRNVVYETPSIFQTFDKVLSHLIGV